MQGLVFVIGIIIMISSFYKSEKKKKEEINRQANWKPNRNFKGKSRSHSFYHSEQKTVEEQILEKAKNTNNLKEPLNFPPVIDIEKPLEEKSEANEFVISEPFFFKEEKADMHCKEEKLPSRKAEKKEKFDETFDGFCASDALYLARKDATERKIWI